VPESQEHLADELGSCRRYDPRQLLGCGGHRVEEARADVRTASMTAGDWQVHVLPHCRWVSADMQDASMSSLLEQTGDGRPAPLEMLQPPRLAHDIWAAPDSAT
jgi:hypothetical protein